jgi:hypothetical protein
LIRFARSQTDCTHLETILRGLAIDSPEAAENLRLELLKSIETLAKVSVYRSRL